jgi:transposase-like protein
MEFQIGKHGRRVYPKDFKLQVIREIEGGKTIAEVSRSYRIPVLTVLKWRQKFRQAPLETSSPPPQGHPDSVPLAEYRKLLEENRLLKRSLANMTLDRDILKDGIEIAAKKKWI